MSYDNTNRGQIWPNDRKEKDTHPDFKGSINVEGKEYWLSAWKRKEGANPKAPSLSFSIQPKVEPHPGAYQGNQTQSGADQTQPRDYPEGGGVLDDIPF